MVGPAHARVAEHARQRDVVAAATRGALAAIGAPAGALLRGERLEDKGMAAGSPLMVRIFKEESELEVWLLTAERFELFARYAVCFWSGTLGPKLREGDRQAPEGLYGVGIAQLHRTGRRPRSFDIGYPNALDRTAGHTGSDIFIHGGCNSRGCFAMTDAVMGEIYALGEAALAHGQDRIPVEVFPFRMTEANMTRHADSPWLPFWTDLKPAYDAFERTHLPPPVAMCGGRYRVLEGAAGSAPAGDGSNAGTGCAQPGDPAVLVDKRAPALHPSQHARGSASSAVRHTRAHADLGRRSRARQIEHPSPGRGGRHQRSQRADHQGAPSARGGVALIWAPPG
jgi:hypothetical protein